MMQSLSDQSQSFHVVKAVEFANTLQSNRKRPAVVRIYAYKDTTSHTSKDDHTVFSSGSSPWNNIFAMPLNRIAVYGHRGWASSTIVAALIASGAPIKVLYRPGSNTSSLPDSVVKIAVDLAHQEAVIAALQDVDIVM